MNTIDQRTEAQRLLNGLENGTIGTADASIMASNLDPVLVFIIVRFLRESYPASDPAATPVLERVVAMTNRDPKLVSMFKQGEEDPISRWFEQDYSYRDYKGRPVEMIELIVDKIET